ncbi:YhfX family PLP-dependent enzyme [Serratia liquefaciens]|uniref:YhfX family PLP-dependent enzyme n=1 Tax=Serratia liquefaciens TaxID=614 RepID=UPI0021832844|nr:YhfX family PLP-dependent enzyme [Serratia liquefaciens]CAI2531479.1 Alanine racemase, N-terminal domain [Serratia liquefaciens]
MFITALQRQNPALIGTAVSLWQQRILRPDSYVIDVDTVEENARQILQIAQQHHLTPYVMSKQFGRNPWLCQRIINLGFPGAAAVDFKEAQQLMQHRVPLCHAGHLVQIPDGEIAAILKQRPEAITVFSIEKARSVAEQAKKIGITQSLLLKVYQEGDLLYPGQEGGFLLDDVVTAARQITQLGHVQVVGVTHFPCLLSHKAGDIPQTTPNFATLIEAVARLRQAGFQICQINAPSANSCSSLPMLAQLGVTHIEPGHAFTGTFPANVFGTEPERLAMLYLTEISHHYKELSFCYGGGHYRRSHVQHALVFTPDGQMSQTEVVPPEDHSIDYYLGLRGTFPIGSVVIMCFRTQIFVTRSDVAMVCGISRGAPQLAGVFDSQGNRLSHSGDAR